jgi:hypothetical protein
MMMNGLADLKLENHLLSSEYSYLNCLMHFNEDLIRGMKVLVPFGQLHVQEKLQISFYELQYWNQLYICLVFCYTSLYYGST